MEAKKNKLIWLMITLSILIVCLITIPIIVFTFTQPPKEEQWVLDVDQALIDNPTIRPSLTLLDKYIEEVDIDFKTGLVSINTNPLFKSNYSLIELNTYNGSGYLLGIDIPKRLENTIVFINPSVHFDDINIFDTNDLLISYRNVIFIANNIDIDINLYIFNDLNIVDSFMEVVFKGWTDEQEVKDSKWYFNHSTSIINSDQNTFIPNKIEIYNSKSTKVNNLVPIGWIKESFEIRGIYFQKVYII